VGNPAPIDKVRAALRKLEEAQFIRNTQEGWKLQTAQEKNWETEKKAFDPKPRDRNEILRNVLREIFSDASIRMYRYRELRTFRIGISVDGTTVGDEGDIKISLATAEDQQEISKRIDQIRDESRQTEHKNDLYWVFSLTSEIDTLVAQIFASRKMIEKYDLLRAQNRITSEESSCLQDEKNAVQNYDSQLIDKVKDALVQGTGMFRGVAKEAASLGKELSEIIRKYLDDIVPDLYPKLEIGSRPLRGNEAEVFLKAADLKALPSVFYNGEHGLGLVIKEGSAFVPNQDAPVAKEILEYLTSQHEYGNRDACMGKALEHRFNGTPYGWERDLLRLVLAVLFRAGAIEVSFNGQKFNSYTEPVSHEPFINNTRFRSAVFTPVKPIDLRTLTQAARSYEQLTGSEVDVDKSAIAEAAKQYVKAEIDEIIPILAEVRAHNLPVLDVVEEYKEELQNIEHGSPDDCVNLLAGHSAFLKESKERVRKISSCLDDKGLAILEKARLVVKHMCRELETEYATGQW
ncbi:MAG: hypothetical protein N3A02_03495, partial [Rectinema sp.]|nr:hypothetical protein [Rectinema sp.]